MSKKTRKKGGQAPRAQQQQDAAAKRLGVAVTAGRGMLPAAPRPEGPGQPAPRTQVRHYLDVSAVRIQDWLTRTPDLKFRRGGSVLLTEATARDIWEKEMPPGVRWNDEAGELDGVVALVVADSVADAEARHSLELAARTVALRMRAAMPYCPVQAVTGTGDSYAAAYEGMEQARRDGSLVVDSPPAPPEAIVAKPCDQCRSAAAVRPGVIIAGADRDRQDLCLDCHARFEAAGGTKGDQLRRSPLPERRMKEALKAAGMQVQGFPDNFKAMATAGQLEQDNAATQLALVYADGNMVGAFLSEAARSARRSGRPAKADIVPALDQATLAALADAIIDRFRGWSRPPVLANLAGGDDLLVSVPAIDAWLFVRTLLEAFGRHIDAATRGWPGPVRDQLPSLSAGLVFHHLTAPFSDVVRLAGEQLRAAKNARRGTEPTVAFLDLTADGGHRVPGREPLTLAYLAGNAGLLERVEQIPKSRRETLVALHRQAVETSVGGADTETPGEEFIRRLTDLDNGPLWEAVAGPGAGPGADADDARQVLTERPEKLNDLRRLLDVARYWHTAPRAESAHPSREAVGT